MKKFCWKRDSPFQIPHFHVTGEINIVKYLLDKIKFSCTCISLHDELWQISSEWISVAFRYFWPEFPFFEWFWSVPHDPFDLLRNWMSSFDVYSFEYYLFDQSNFVNAQDLHFCLYEPFICLFSIIYKGTWFQHFCCSLGISSYSCINKSRTARWWCGLVFMLTSLCSRNSWNNSSPGGPLGSSLWVVWVSVFQFA